MRSLPRYTVQVLTGSSPETPQNREDDPGIDEPPSPFSVDAFTTVPGAMR